MLKLLCLPVMCASGLMAKQLRTRLNSIRFQFILHGTMWGLTLLDLSHRHPPQAKKYILTLSDYFTKWVEAVPLPSKEVPGVASVLYKIFLRMGFPKLLTSDQGGEFRSQLDKEMMKLLGIRHHHTTPYHPQVNGLDERWNQTMKRMLVKFMNTDKAAWDEHLDHCMFAYNTSRHESSLYSPFEVMFGWKATIPIELEYEKEGSVLLKAYLQEPTVDSQ